MKTVGIINGSKVQDGIHVGLIPLSDALSILGYTPKWYNYVDPKRRDQYPTSGERVFGRNYGNEKLSIGLNRFLMLPDRLRKFPEDIIFLGDPTLLRLAKYHNNAFLKVHDLRPFTEYRDNVLLPMLYRANWHLMSEVRKIVVPTEFVKNELVQRSVSADGIYILHDYLGFEPVDHFNLSTLRLEEKNEIRVIYIAVDKPHKNIPFFLQVVKRIQESGTETKFSFTLVSRLRNETKELVKRLNLRNLRILSGLETIQEIYAEADVLLFPSKYEGFGRPVMEALGHGLPVLASDISSLREVAQDSAIFLDPSDVEEWVISLIKMGDRPQYSRMAEMSIKRAGHFSFQRYTNDVGKIFDST